MNGVILLTCFISAIILFMAGILTIIFVSDSLVPDRETCVITRIHPTAQGALYWSLDIDVALEHASPYILPKTFHLDSLTPDELDAYVAYYSEPNTTFGCKLTGLGAGEIVRVAGMRTEIPARGPKTIGAILVLTCGAVAIVGSIGLLLYGAHLDTKWRINKENNPEDAPEEETKEREHLKTQDYVRDKKGEHNTLGHSIIRLIETGISEALNKDTLRKIVQEELQRASAPPRPGGYVHPQVVPSFYNNEYQ